MSATYRQPYRPHFDDVAMVQLAMGWVAPETYARMQARDSQPNPDRGYVCGKSKHDAAVARRKKRKRGGPK